MKQEMKEKLTDDILNILSKCKSELIRRNYKLGYSVSHIKDLLMEKGWKNLGGTADFEGLVEELGFSVVPALTSSGIHKSARVITL